MCVNDAAPPGLSVVIRPPSFDDLFGAHDDQVRPFNAGPGYFGKLRRTAGVIEMTVGDERHLWLKVHQFDEIDDFRKVTARIDHRRAISFLAPEDRAILRVAGNGKDVEFHDGTIAPPFPQ